MTAEQIKEYMSSFPELQEVDLSYITEEFLKSMSDAEHTPINPGLGSPMVEYCNGFVRTPSTWSWYSGAEGPAGGDDPCGKKYFYQIPADKGSQIASDGTCRQGYPRFAVVYRF